MRDLSLLPSNPVAFFELPSGYDRRDLKRAYGKAIRQYKPETHPAEFQLIREAYEDLEQALRYGQDRKRQQQAAQAWEPTSRSVEEAALQPTSPNPSNSKKRSSSLTFRELAVVDAKLALKKFETMKRRTAPDYYVAAVLSDAVAGKSTQKYLVLLLDGLAAFPSDPGLHQLISEYVRNETPDSLIEKTLQFTVGKIRGPLFYALTEPLWLRLLERKQPNFDSFHSLLVSCERQIQQTDLTARDAFYLRIARLAVWIAPAKWTTNVLTELESRSASMDDESQSDLEFATEIQELLHLSGGQKQRSPVRSKLFQALRLACGESSHQSLRQILALLDEVARDSNAFERDFPIEQAKEDEGWVGVVYRLVIQVHPFIVDSDDQVSPQRQIEQTGELLNDLNEDSPKIYSALKSGDTVFQMIPFLLWVVGGSIGLTIPIAVAFMSLSTGGLSVVITIVAVIAAMVGLFVSFQKWLFPRFLEPKLTKVKDRGSKSAYRVYWRSRLFRFARSSSEPLESNLAKIQFLADRSRKADLGNAVRHFVSQDAGLQAYSILQLVRT